MIRVILPQNNTNLINDLTDDIIADVVLRVFGIEKFFYRK